MCIRDSLYKDSGPDILDALAGAQHFNGWMAETIQPYIGKRVLEIGAGIGNLTRILSPRRERYIAGDIDPEYLARLHARFQHRPKMEVRRCDLSNPVDFEALAGAVDSVAVSYTHLDVYKRQVQCTGDKLAGVVRYCVYREIGYFVGIELEASRCV